MWYVCANSASVRAVPSHMLASEPLSDHVEPNCGLIVFPVCLPLVIWFFVQLSIIRLSLTRLYSLAAN